MICFWTWLLLKSEHAWETSNSSAKPTRNTKVWTEVG